MRRPLTVLLVALVWAMAAPAPAQATTTGWAAPMPRPLVVVRAFEAPVDPYGPGHRGVDLGASPGSAVRSPGDGTVRFAGPVAGHGVVSVDAGGLRFTYEPVLPQVRAGQHVGRGAVLGSLLAGHPGCRATAGSVCLHWGVRLGAHYLDPLRPVAPRVRLLPLSDGTRPVGAVRVPPAPGGVLAAATLVAVGAALLGRRGSRRRRGS